MSDSNTTDSDTKGRGRPRIRPKKGEPVRPRGRPKRPEKTEEDLLRDKETATRARHAHERRARLGTTIHRLVRTGQLRDAIQEAFAVVLPDISQETKQAALQLLFA